MEAMKKHPPLICGLQNRRGFAVRFTENDFGANWRNPLKLTL
ncbi:hypothetical protein HDE70_003972 [Pedobacter cryoconitis]|nr:hypothetical protein [Pedobacter cryoconitis]